MTQAEHASGRSSNVVRVRAQNLTRPMRSFCVYREANPLSSDVPTGRSVKNAIRSRTAASPRAPVRPTGMIEFALGRICSISMARDQRGVGVGIGDPDRVGPFGTDDPNDDLSVLGRHRIRQ